MSIVSTTAGPLDVAKLGFVLPHEHVLISSPDVRLVWPESFDHAKARERCIAHIPELLEAGVSHTQIDQMTRDSPCAIFAQQEPY